MSWTPPASRSGFWTVLLVFALACQPIGLRAQGFEDLAAPGEEAPALPGGGLFDLKSLSDESDSGGAEEFKGRDKDPEVSISWSPLPGSPETGVLAIHVQLQDGARTYGLEPVTGFKKNTKIKFDDVPGATPIDEAFVPDHAPKTAPDPLLDNLVLHKYFHEVTYLRRYRLDSGTPPTLAGKIDMLVCRNGCSPHKEELTGEWSSEPYSGPLPAEWGIAGAPNSGSSNSNPNDGSAGGATIASSSLIEVEKSAPLSFAYALGLAFLGGMIMNVMPCVLPVIAIKVLSFVQQAGESRSRIFALNLTYSIGVISVFLGLGTLATFAKVGLGQLFQYDGFNVVMACVVFAMGLSLLGVFEFSLPGSLGGGGEHHEGLTGAFFTGILATLLATPCIGPFVSGVLVWSVTQPTAVIYLIWGTLGLGMASPYLLIGLFPSLINRMPRPGMWMVRFKEFSGFVLMATVIFLINSISPEQLIPTLVILLGVALGLWMIGNLYDHSTPTEQKWKVRIAAVLVSLPLIGFGALQQWGVEKLPWKPFSEAKLIELRKSGKPILIDFTADWCAVCKTNERLSLNTKKTADFVKTNDVVCMKADFTDESPEIKAWLDRFGAAGVPLVVIFPPGEAAKGIKFDALFTQSRLLNTMEEAWKKSGATAPDQTTSTVNSDTESRQVH